MGGWYLRMTWGQEDRNASLHGETAFALSLPTVWSHLGIPGWLGVERCQICMQDTSCSAKCPIDGFFSILEKTASQLICTRPYATPNFEIDFDGVEKNHIEFLNWKMGNSKSFFFQITKMLRLIQLQVSEKNQA